MGTTVLKIADLSITKILQSSHAIHCCATDDRICMQLSTPPTTLTLTTKTNSHNDHNTHKAQQHCSFPQTSQLVHNAAQMMISVIWAIISFFFFLSCCIILIKSFTLIFREKRERRLQNNGHHLWIFTQMDPGPSMVVPM